jgi:O-antigen/teichoic acid export membrane protein
VLATLANRLLSTAVFIVLSRLLDPKAFGVVALASVAVVILQAIAESGLGRALVRSPKLTPELIDTAFWAGTIWSGALAILLAALSVPLAIGFGDRSAAPILAAMSGALLLSGLQSVQLGLLSREMKFRSISLREVVGAIVGAIVGIALALAGAGPWALVGQLLATQLASVVALWAVSDWRPGRSFRPALLRDLLRQGFSFTMVSLSGTLQRNLDNLIVGTFLGVVSLGYYSVAYRLFLLVCSVTVDATVNIGLPTFSKLRHSPQRMTDAFYRAVNLSCRVTLPAFIFLAVEGNSLVTLTSGQKWEPAGRLLIALCPAGIMLAITTFDGSVLFAMGQLRSVVILTIVTAVATTAAFLIGVQFGTIGVAFGYGAGLLAMWPMRIVLLRRCMPLVLSTYFSELADSISMCVPMSIALVALHHFHVLGRGWLAVALAASVLFFLYAPVVAIFDRPTVLIFSSALRSAMGKPRINVDKAAVNHNPRHAKVGSR